MNRWKAKQARVLERRLAAAAWRAKFGRLVEATFQPRDVHTVRASARELIGERLTWRASWLIGPDDHVTYAGQWAWLPEPQNLSPGRGHLGWAPECDLADPVPVDEH